VSPRRTTLDQRSHTTLLVTTRLFVIEQVNVAPWTTTEMPTMAPLVVNTVRKGIDGRKQCHGCGAMYSGPNGKVHAKQQKGRGPVPVFYVQARLIRQSIHLGCRRDRRATGRGSRRARGVAAAPSSTPQCIRQALAAKSIQLASLASTCNTQVSKNANIRYVHVFVARACSCSTCGACTRLPD